MSSTNSMESSSERCHLLFDANGDIDLVPYKYSKEQFSVHFDYIRTVGCGSFGEVMLAISKKNKKIKLAVKEVLAHDLHRELCVFAAVQNHDNIIPLYCYFTYGIESAIVMPLCSGTLQQWYKTIDVIPSAVYEITKQCAGALAWMHSKSIIHCDVKASNVLVKEMSVVPHCFVSDFGSARTIGTLSNACYTFYYKPPEILLNGDVIDGSMDIWALGATILELTLKQLPFYGAMRQRQLIAIQCLTVGFPLEDKWGCEFKYSLQDIQNVVKRCKLKREPFNMCPILLKKILQFFPDERLSGQQLVDYIIEQQGVSMYI